MVAELPGGLGALDLAPGAGVRSDPHPVFLLQVAAVPEIGLGVRRLWFATKSHVDGISFVGCI